MTTTFGTDDILVQHHKIIGGLVICLELYLVIYLDKNKSDLILNRASM